MNLIDLPFTMTEEEKQRLRKSIVETNFLRGKLFAKVIIGIESTLSIIDIVSSIPNNKIGFHYHFYLMMYLIMILLNVLFLVVANKFERSTPHQATRIQPFETLLILYLILFMVWGSIIALVDQRLYGQLIAFVINVISASVIFVIDNKKILLLYGASTILLLGGLPFFQSSTNILIGHYINLSIFLFFAWIASRILYQSYCSNFHSKMLLKQANQLLIGEIEENRDIRQKLEKANEELRNLTLVDELTGIPNRRAFNQYVDFMLQHQLTKESNLSIIMIDVDYFKLFNDYYGHAEGDKVIQSVGQRLNESVRHSLDFAARIGGEEFVFIAFNANNEEIHSLAESIKNKVHEMRIPHECSKVSKWVTASLGTVTGKVRNQVDFETLLISADNALYTAKENGRNGIHSFNQLVKI